MDKALLKKLADWAKQEQRNINMNPLSWYSTSQLKDELRRRRSRK